MSRADAILWLILSPFVATVVFLIACAVAYVARVERKNIYAPSPATAESRELLLRRAFEREGEQ